MHLSSKQTQTDPTPATQQRLPTAVELYWLVFNSFPNMSWPAQRIYDMVVLWWMQCSQVTLQEEALYVTISAPFKSMRKMLFSSRVHANLQPALSAHWSVSRSVGHVLLFLKILCHWPHCSCPNGLVPSYKAPAHPHATLVAVYSALLLIWITVNSFLRGSMGTL